MLKWIEKLEGLRGMYDAVVLRSRFLVLTVRFLSVRDHGG
jgi:hypothetical protein